MKRHAKLSGMNDLKELIIQSCEKWLQEHTAPNDWLPLSREAVEELLKVLKSNT